MSRIIITAGDDNPIIPFHAFTENDNVYELLTHDSTGLQIKRARIPGAYSYYNEIEEHTSTSGTYQSPTNSDNVVLEVSDSVTGSYRLHLHPDEVVNDGYIEFDIFGVEDEQDYELMSMAFLITEIVTPLLTDDDGYAQASVKSIDDAIISQKTFADPYLPLNESLTLETPEGEMIGIIWRKEES